MYFPTPLSWFNERYTAVAIGKMLVCPELHENHLYICRFFGFSALAKANTFTIEATRAAGSRCPKTSARTMRMQSGWVWRRL
jgi:hypothetical protein